jgi:xanthine dehydrogenase small subunit
MNAKLTLTNKENSSRQLALKDFYLGYKTLNKTADEIIAAITFEVPKTNKFNFEKVCKRQYLDIASVNTACAISVDGTTISNADFSMGGVGPIPKYLAKTSAFLVNQSISIEVIKEAEKILQTEITPISDARGTVAYKRLLARQLFLAHFITLFPETFKMDDLVW